MSYQTIEFSSIYHHTKPEPNWSTNVLMPVSLFVGAVSETAVISI